MRGGPGSVHLEGLTLGEAFDALVADPEFMVDVDRLIFERGCTRIGLVLPILLWPQAWTRALRQMRTDKMRRLGF